MPSKVWPISIVSRSKSGERGSTMLIDGGKSRWRGGRKKEEMKKREGKREVEDICILID